jgi:hypothetical protein
MSLGLPLRSLLLPLLVDLASTEFAFTFASRSCNTVTHLLAKQVTDTKRSELWHVTTACVCDLILISTFLGFDVQQSWILGLSILACINPDCICKVAVCHRHSDKSQLTSSVKPNFARHLLFLVSTFLGFSRRKKKLPRV